MNAAELIEQAKTRGALDERAGKALLTEYGVAVPQSVVVKTPDAAAGGLAALKPPFVVKVMSPDILHKSDVGGVKIGLADAAAVADAIRTMQAVPAIAKARVEGFLVEEMAPRGVEVVIGGMRDADFGPMVMVGLGGIFVEVLKDVAFRICPITRVDAAEMLDELKGAKILDGARGGIKASREAIVDTLLKIGGENGLLLQHAATIREADINPLIVSERGAVAADARFILG